MYFLIITSLCIQCRHDIFNDVVSRYRVFTCSQSLFWEGIGVKPSLGLYWHKCMYMIYLSLSHAKVGIQQRNANSYLISRGCVVFDYIAHEANNVFPRRGADKAGRSVLLEWLADCVWIRHSHREVMTLFKFFYSFTKYTCRLYIVLTHIESLRCHRSPMSLPFWCWDRNMPGQLGQYPGNWCRGSGRQQPWCWCVRLSITNMDFNYLCCFIFEKIHMYYYDF